MNKDTNEQEASNIENKTKDSSNILVHNNGEESPRRAEDEADKLMDNIKSDRTKMFYHMKQLQIGLQLRQDEQLDAEIESCLLTELEQNEFDGQNQIKEIVNNQKASKCIQALCKKVLTVYEHKIATEKQAEAKIQSIDAQAKESANAHLAIVKELHEKIKQQGNIPNEEAKEYSKRIKEMEDTIVHLQKSNQHLAQHKSAIIAESRQKLENCPK